MELSKHKNHRNNRYLSWLREQKCVVSGEKAQCAHHIRLGTNGGKGLKPSDYFCIPLLNEYHTTGKEALHLIGEDTFLKRFNIEPHLVFTNYLYRFLKEVYDLDKSILALTSLDAIELLIEEIEKKKPASDKKKKTKKKKSVDSNLPKAKFSDSPYYQKSKELKKQRDKELRDKVKEEKKATSSPKPKSKNKTETSVSDFELKAKELKKLRDKELRLKLKEAKKKEEKKDKKKVVSKKVKKISKKPVKKEEDEYSLRAKELVKERQKAFREENKAKQSKIRKELYQKAKAYKKSLKK